MQMSLTWINDTIYESELNFLKIEKSNEVISNLFLVTMKLIVNFWDSWLSSLIHLILLIINDII